MAEAPRITEALSEFEKRYRGAVLNAVGGYWNFVADVIRDPACLPSAYGKFAESNIGSYKDAMEASVDLTRSLYSFKPGAAETENRQQTGNGAPAPAPGELLFDGAQGEVASRQFVVANKTKDALEIAFELSEFQDAAGNKVRVEAEVEPAKFHLDPGAEKVVECRLPLVESFATGRDYRAILRAMGHPSMQVVLVVRTTAAAPKSEEPR